MCGVPNQIVSLSFRFYLLGASLPMAKDVGHACFQVFSRGFPDPELDSQTWKSSSFQGDSQTRQCIPRTRRWNFQNSPEPRWMHPGQNMASNRSSCTVLKKPSGNPCTFSEPWCGSISRQCGSGTPMYANVYSEQKAHPSDHCNPQGKLRGSSDWSTSKSSPTARSNSMTSSKALSDEPSSAQSVSSTFRRSLLSWGCFTAATPPAESAARAISPRTTTTFHDPALGACTATSTHAVKPRKNHGCVLAEQLIRMHHSQHKPFDSHHPRRIAHASSSTAFLTA